MNKIATFLVWLTTGTILGWFSYISAMAYPGNFLTWPIYPLYLQWILKIEKVPDIAYMFFLLPAMILNWLILSAFAMFVFKRFENRSKGKSIS